MSLIWRHLYKYIYSTDQFFLNLSFPIIVSSCGTDWHDWWGWIGGDDAWMWSHNQGINWPFFTHVWINFLEEGDFLSMEIQNWNWGTWMVKDRLMGSEWMRWGSHKNIIGLLVQSTRRWLSIFSEGLTSQFGKWRGMDLCTREKLSHQFWTIEAFLKLSLHFQIFSPGSVP